MTRTQEIRNALGWQQWRLAEYLGVAQPTVQRIEKGQDEPGPISRLLDILAMQVGRADLVRQAPCVDGAVAGETGQSS